MNIEKQEYIANIKVNIDLYKLSFLQKIHNVSEGFLSGFLEESYLLLELLKTFDVAEIINILSNNKSHLDLIKLGGLHIIDTNSHTYGRTIALNMFGIFDFNELWKI